VLTSCLLEFAVAVKQAKSLKAQNVSTKQKRKEDAEDLAELIYDMFIKAEIKKANEENENA
jgi:hypothetical protein